MKDMRHRSPFLYNDYTVFMSANYSLYNW